MKSTKKHKKCISETYIGAMLRRRRGRECGGVPTDKIGSNYIYVDITKSADLHIIYHINVNSGEK